MLKNRSGRYAAAGVAFAAALAVRGVMAPELGSTARYMTFFAAVMFASWYGGLGPGLLVTALSAVATQFLFVKPLADVGVTSLADALDLLLFLAIGVFISILNQQRHTAMELAATQSAALQQESRERERVQISEAETRRWARDTLSSIGDGVICTDEDSAVTYMNSVAQDLTAWTLDEAKGLPLKDVFAVINGETRAPVPVPLGRIFEGERISGFAPQAILVSRNGGEIPIDDSGAPIRDARRQIVGAVLVFRDITNQKHVENSLRDQIAELSSSNSDLADYAYAISHDLQEPLRTVGAFSQIIKRKYRERLDAEADQYLDYIARGAERMSRMIRDLLTFSRTIHMRSEMKPVRLADAVRWAEQNLDELIRETGAVVRLDDLPTVMADHVQLVQVFQNLIGNAMKYRSEKSPQIAISATDAGSCWQVSVADNGVGVPQADRERIFGLFKRGQSEVPGSGVGLAICKRIISRHRGTIWVESESGRGSTFHFTLSKSFPVMDKPARGTAV